MRNLILLFIAPFLLLTIHAQNEEEKAVEQTLLDVAKAISDIHKVKDPGSVLKYFEKSYVEHENRFYIDQQMQTIIEPYQSLVSMIEGYATEQGLVVDYRVTKFLKTIAKNDRALTIADCEFSIFKNGERQYSARETQTISMVKNNGQWRLILNQTTKFIDDVLRGECMADFYRDDDENYVAKVSYPAGDKWGEKFYSFQLSALDANNTNFEIGTQYYNWNKNSKEILSLNLQNKSNKVVGNAITESAVMLHIIGDLAKEQCTKVVLKSYPDLNK